MAWGFFDAGALVGECYGVNDAGHTLVADTDSVVGVATNCPEGKKITDSNGGSVNILSFKGCGGKHVSVKGNRLSFSSLT